MNELFWTPQPTLWRRPIVKYFLPALCLRLLLQFQVFDAAPVVRVDEGLGLLLHLPLGGELGGSCPAFCHVSNAADTPPTKLAAVAKAGATSMKVRVMGFRLVDGLASVSCRTQDLEQQVRQGGREGEGRRRAGRQRW